MDGVNAADQMGDVPHGGGGFGGGFPSGGFRPGGGAGVHHMSPEDAQEFFSHFFGGSDPFGGGFGGPGFSSSMNGGRRRGRPVDPFSPMFGGGMPGMGMGGMPGGMAMGGFDDFQQQPRQSQRQVKRYDAIPPGTMVSLKNLVKRPDRNGDRGEIQSFDPSTGRYVVVLEDSEETMSVKPDNLLQHVHVRLYGIESLQDLNGKTGTILAWNHSKERYNVYVVALSKVVSVKPSNVILENDTVAQITGIVAKPELNGKWGTIKEWIRDSNRYEVQLSADKVVRIKVENMRV